MAATGRPRTRAPKAPEQVAKRPDGRASSAMAKATQQATRGSPAIPKPPAAAHRPAPAIPATPQQPRRAGKHAQPRPARRDKGRDPMARVDTAWLRMERPTNPMMITGVLMFAEPMQAAQLRRVIAQRWL